MLQAPVVDVIVVSIICPKCPIGNPKFKIPPINLMVIVDYNLLKLFNVTKIELTMVQFITNVNCIIKHQTRQYSDGQIFADYILDALSYRDLIKVPVAPVSGIPGVEITLFATLLQMPIMRQSVYVEHGDFLWQIESMI